MNVADLLAGAGYQPPAETKPEAQPAAPPQPAKPAEPAQAQAPQPAPAFDAAQLAEVVATAVAKTMAAQAAQKPADDDEPPPTFAGTLAALAKSGVRGPHVDPGGGVASAGFGQPPSDPMRLTRDDVARLREQGRLKSHLEDAFGVGIQNRVFSRDRKAPFRKQGR